MRLYFPHLSSGENLAGAGGAVPAPQTGQTLFRVYLPHFLQRRMRFICSRA